MKNCKYTTQGKLLCSENIEKFYIEKKKLGYINLFDSINKPTYHGLIKKIINPKQLITTTTFEPEVQIPNFVEVSIKQTKQQIRREINYSGIYQYTPQTYNKYVYISNDNRYALYWINRRSRYNDTGLWMIIENGPELENCANPNSSSYGCANYRIFSKIFLNKKMYVKRIFPKRKEKFNDIFDNKNRKVLRFYNEIKPITTSTIPITTSTIPIITPTIFNL